METLKTSNIQEIVSKLKSGMIGVMPSDTIYGIHCLANSQDAIKRIYQAKERGEGVPFITLIAEAHSLENFGIHANDYQQKIMDEMWPGPNTLIFEMEDGQTRSFRVPRNDFVMSILDETGPLISTSANKHGMPPSKTIEDAIGYFSSKARKGDATDKNFNDADQFSDEMDFYVDGGELNNLASSIYKVYNNHIEKIR